MNKGISDRDRRYGQLIIDFANAKTSDEAGLKFLENIKKAFGFPDKLPTYKTGEYYVDEAYQFPTMESFKAKLETDITDSRQKEIINKFITSYPSHLRFRHTSTTGGFIFPNVHREQRMVIEMDPYISDPVEGSWEHDKDGDGIYTRGMNIAIVEECKKNGLTEKEENRITWILDSYFEHLEPEHRYVDKLRSELNHILSAVVISKDYDDRALSIFCRLNEIYNKANNDTSVFEPSDDGSFVITTFPTFGAEFFINREDTCPALCLEDYYDRPIAYFLMTFFKEPQNQMYLRKCLICEDYYISGSVAREVYCEKTECSKLYDRFRKRWQRETEPEVYDATKSPEYHPAYERLKDYWKNKPAKKSKKKSVP